MRNNESSSSFFHGLKEKLAAGITLAAIAGTGISCQTYKDNFGAAADQSKMEMDIAYLQREINIQTQRSNKREAARLSEEMHNIQNKLEEDPRSPEAERISQIILGGTLISAVGFGIIAGSERAKRAVNSEETSEIEAQEVEG